MLCDFSYGLAPFANDGAHHVRLHQDAQREVEGPLGTDGRSVNRNAGLARRPTTLARKLRCVL